MSSRCLVNGGNDQVEGADLESGDVQKTPLERSRNRILLSSDSAYVIDVGSCAGAFSR